VSKKATNPHKKAKHAAAWQRGKDRKSLRVAEETNRARANRAAGKTPKRQTRKRPRYENMRLCMRCETRRIVAGSVCWCKTIGADIASRRARA
jgi:hypothetical protein